MILRRESGWRGLLGRAPRPVLTLCPEGLVLEEKDLVAWPEIEAVGRFATQYGHGVGVRLRDPVHWYAAHPGPWRSIRSVIALERGPILMADLLGRADALPAELPAQVEWARTHTGGWDLTIPDHELWEVDDAVARLTEYWRRYS